MILRIGKFPSNDEFEDKSGWIPLKEPENMWITQLIALPIGIILAGLLFLIINHYTSYTFPQISIIYIFAFLFIIPIHEIFHALLFPGGLKSKHTILGFCPETFVFYALFMSKIKRNRFIASLLAPLVIISFLPMLFIVLTSTQNDFLVLTVLFNAFSSCADVFSVVLLYTQVPDNGITLNDGAKTYWMIE